MPKPQLPTVSMNIWWRLQPADNVHNLNPRPQLVLKRLHHRFLCTPHPHRLHPRLPHTSLPATRGQNRLTLTQKPSIRGFATAPRLLYAALMGVAVIAFVCRRTRLHVASGGRLASGESTRDGGEPGRAARGCHGSREMHPGMVCFQGEGRCSRSIGQLQAD